MMTALSITTVIFFIGILGSYLYIKSSKKHQDLNTAAIWSGVLWIGGSTILFQWVVQFVIVVIK